ncbi:AAA family ATPase [Corynebacterium coyleae]|uniref:AAA family ATPase n=1 Tax=Corynebacterium coyleae TaxID=53374 RepID=UPI00255008CE|nr:ATP-binding protein [Corynebacterium coyleae]MDK8823354.1 AAA family ATPase [Corynebacterium coyleae]
MILAFEVKNYRSFAESASLHFTKRFLKTNHPSDGDWVAATNRVAGLFGPNASGKTTLLEALWELCTYPVVSMRSDKLLRSMYKPHRLQEDREVEFFLDFEYQGKRFRWELLLDNEGITYEHAEVNETGQWKKIFERNENAVTFGGGSLVSRAARNFIRQGATSWVSVVAPWGKSQNPGEYVEAFVNLCESAEFISPHSRLLGGLSPKLQKMLDDRSWGQLATPVMHFADVGVSALKKEEKETPELQRKLFKSIFALIESSELAPSADDVDEIPIPDKENVWTFVHSGAPGDTFELNVVDESLGTVSWLETALPALEIISRGGLMIVDELDSSLHPMLVRQLISLFEDEEINWRGAQLAFSSHDLTLLGNFPKPALTMDSAWLCEKINGASKIRSIDEYKLPSTANAEKRYMQGVFGAVPLVPQRKVASGFYELFRDLHSKSFETDENREDK